MTGAAKIASALPVIDVHMIGHTHDGKYLYMLWFHVVLRFAM
jgi:hypothetical protein